MSKVCITIPEECKSCYKLCIEYCPTGINIQAGLVDGDIYFLFAIDHFGNVWRDEVTINPDGSFDIDLANYPSGFFTSTSGAVNIFLSLSEDGANPIDITFDTGTYNCILITTEPQVNFVDPDITVFNPGNSACGIVPSFQVQWGDIGGDILNQTDLIDYIASQGIGLSCEDLPECQTIIDIESTLLNKFDIPTGTASDYLDGTGTPTPLSSIPSGLKSGIATASVTDVYTTTITGVTSYTTNDAYVVKFNTANSNGATININGLGAVQLTKNNDVILTGGDITVGQEFIIIYDGTNFQMLGIAPNQMFAYVTNADSVAITKGQPVYAFGASGDRMSVKLSNNTSEATSSKTVGLVFSNSIASGGLGFVITQGVLSNVNTAAYSPGNTLYVGASAGALTNVLPTAPNHLTRIGIVERANPGNGLIYVLVQNGFQLDELSDVDITSVAPVNNDVLTYVTGVNNLWKPRSISTILGYTPLADTTWVDYSATSTITGWTSFVNKILRYKVVGKQVFVSYLISGTSNSTSTSFTLPFTSVSAQYNEAPNRSFNNGVAYHGFGIISASSSTMSFSYWTTATANTSTWTASGTKWISGQIFYEIA